MTEKQRSGPPTTLKPNAHGSPPSWTDSMPPTRPGSGSATVSSSPVGRVPRCWSGSRPPSTRIGPSELARAIDAVVDIAADRAAKLGDPGVGGDGA